MSVLQSRREPNLRNWVGLFWFFIFFSIAVRILTKQYLYADGSFQILLMLKDTNYYLDTGREFTQLILQTPFFVAWKIFHIDSIRYLAVFISLGYFGIPTLILFLSWKLTVNTYFEKQVLFSTLLLLSTSSASMSESFFANSLMVFIFALLHSKNVLQNESRVFLLFVSGIISIRTYDSFFIINTFVMLTLLFPRFFRIQKITVTARILLLVPIFCSIFSSGYFVLLRQSNFSYAPTNLYLSFHNAVFVLMCFLTFLTLQKPSKVFIHLSIVVALSASVFIIYPFGNLAQHFINRIPITLFLLVFLLLTPLLKRQEKNAKNRSFTGFVAPVIVISIYSIYTSLNWQHFLNEFRQALHDNRNVMRIEESGVNPELYEAFGWDWTNQSMSLILRSSDNDGTILPPVTYLGWIPFTVEDVETFKFKYKW